MSQTELPAELLAAQHELERRNRLYAMLSRINRTIVHAEEAEELYAAACRIAVEDGGFALAWIGLQDPGSGIVLPVAAAGAADIEQLKAVADVAAGQGPTARAVRTASPFVVNDTANDPQRAPWQAMATQWGIRAGAAFPIRMDGCVIGAFSVASGEAGFFRDAEINLMIEVADDISFALEVVHREERRIAAETKLRYLAYYDSQTGMPSRVLFEERLIEACRSAPEQSLAVLVVNLRRYHGIMQLLGPATGLEVIRGMAARLEAAHPAVTVARVTEAKFALMLAQPEGLDVVEELAWSVHRALAGVTQANDQELFLEPFVGIAVYPKDGEPVEVLQHAMLAADFHSQDSAICCRFFNADMDVGSRRRLNLEAALHRALEREEFRLYFQPQVDLASGRIVGAEALLRWQRPDHGLVSPLEFIPVLEENGMIGAVGAWVLHEACRLTRKWQDASLPPFRIAVNLSARQFHEGDIRAIVKRALDATKLDPQWLELELTEGVVLLNAEAAIRIMQDLKKEGVGHALDDFGTGYSSLSYLQRLPIDRIKIDRSFVLNITSNPSAAAIVRAVVSMAHSLGLSVIAEGVETEGQLGFLRGINCEEIQGFLFSRPLPEDEFAKLLAEGRCIPPSDGDCPEPVLLLVDDEPSIISALTRLLRRQHYKIISTTSAREGFELLARHHPGVVICDQRMPEMTGTEFLRRVKELYPETIRIILSGYTELNSVIDAVNHGSVYKFLTKPWDDSSLIDSINDAFRICDLHRKNRELTRLLQERSLDARLSG